MSAIHRAPPTPTQTPIMISRCDLDLDPDAADPGVDAVVSGVVEPVIGNEESICAAS